MAHHPVQVIFVTATVTPKRGSRALALADASARMADYVAAFRVYADLVRRRPDYRLLFVENSGADLSALVRIAADAGITDRTEFVSYVADEDADRTRFYLEGALIRQTLTRSTLAALPGATIWKVTGRYIITNLDRIIQGRPRSFDIYVNSRRYPRPFADFYVGGFSRRGLEAAMTRIRDDLATRDNGEEVLEQALEDGRFSDLTVVRRLRVVPFIRGRRGYDGRRYDGPTQITKYWIRVAMNAVAPRLWI
jgi:hypothetical protein